MQTGACLLGVSLRALWSINIDIHRTKQPFLHPSYFLSASYLTLCLVTWVVVVVVTGQKCLLNLGII